MASILKVDKLDPQSGTALEIGTSGDTVTVPTGAGLTVVDEVKTNKISPASGTDFTLGDSGDTFTVPSGATLDNLGTATGFGTVAWQSVVTASTLSAAAFKGYPINTTSNVCTVTLPAGSVGDTIILVDYAATWDTNNVTLTTTEKIQGSDSDATLSGERESISLVYVDATQGWLVDASADAGITQPVFITATGGTITTDGDYKVHTFTGNGTFEVTQVGSGGGSTSIDYLIVAGGGGGGLADISGAGGGGGMRFNYPNPITGGTPVSATTYPIVVGGGGAVAPSSQGVQGTPSSGFSVTSAGGGGGGGQSGPTGYEGGAGGSGGGSGYNRTSGRAAGNTPPAPVSQGADGGLGANLGPSYGGGGGGGGGNSGVTGGDATAPNGGPGGNGTAITIPGASTSYGGGGGGGNESPTTPTVAPGGTGGGGPGGQNGTAGTVNTGGGGGGSNDSGSGAGGSGVVVVRYKFQ